MGNKGTCSQKDDMEILQEKMIGAVYGIGAWEKGKIRSKSSMKEAFDLGKMV